MVINFPNSPIVGQTYTFNEKTWQWSGSYWEVFSAQTGYVQGAINVGGGEEVFSGKSGNDLYFRTLTGGTNTTISTIGDLIKVDVTIPPDTNTFVTGGTFDNNTDTITFTNNSGGTFNVTGITDNFVSGGTYNPSTLEINFVGNSLDTTFDVDLTSLVSSVSGDTFLVSGNANVATSELTFTYNTGGTFTVTNSAALFADNDINVTGGTYNPSNGCVTFTTNSGTTFDVCGFLTGITDTYVTGGTYNESTDTITFTNTSGSTFDVTGITDTFVIAGTYTDNTDTITLLRNDGNFVNITGVTDTFTTGATYDNNTALATFNRNDGNSYTLDLSTIDVNDTFSTGGTVTQTATSGNSEVIVQIVGNDGFTPYNITGLTDTFVNDFSISSNTFTITQNDGSSFVATADTIDLASVLSAVTFDIGTSGSISATTFSGGTFYGDGSNLTGITNTFVTGGTYNESTHTITLTRNDDVTVDITGVTDTFTTGSTYDNGTATATFTRNDGNTYTLDLSTIDVNDTFVTGFTYDNANTFTLIRNDGVDITTSFNIVTGLTVNGTLSATTLDGNTILSGGTNLTTIIESLDTYVTGGTVSVPATDNSNSGTIGLFYKNSDGTPRTLPFEDTFTTGATYDNGTALATFIKNDGTTYTLDLSTIDVNDTFVTGGTYSDLTDTITLTRNDGVTIDITGVTDNFVIAGTYSDSTDTISLLRKDGSFVNITGVTDTFTTGATYDNGTALATFNRNDGNSYTLDLSTIDVNDTFVTGFTYNNNNTFTISRNDGVDISTSINIVSGLTVNGNLTVTGETSLQSTTASTITLSSTPIENNTNIEILSRNSSTGVVEYRDIATFGVNITTVTATTYTATTTDDVIGFDTTSVSPTLFLPDSTTIGRIRYEVKDIGVNSFNNPITIQAAGSDTIITTSVVSSFELSADGGAVILVSTGTGQWWQM